MLGGGYGWGSLQLFGVFLFMFGCSERTSGDMRCCEFVVLEYIGVSPWLEIILVNPVGA